MSNQTHSQWLRILILFCILFHCIFLLSCSSESSSKNYAILGVWQGNVTSGNIPYLILTQDEAHFVMEYQDLIEIRSCLGTAPLKIASDGQSASIQFGDTAEDLQLNGNQLVFMSDTSEDSLQWFRSENNQVDVCDSGKDYCGTNVEGWSQLTDEGEKCSATLSIGCEDWSFQPGYSCTANPDLTASCNCIDLTGSEWSCQQSAFDCDSANWSSSCCDFDWVK